MQKKVEDQGVESREQGAAIVRKWRGSAILILLISNPRWSAQVAQHYCELLW